MEAAIITTYRCVNHCTRCHTWQNPTKVEDEFRPELLAKLPGLSFCNITGGEPFLRDDLAEIVAVLATNAKRLVVSTNGYFTEKVVALARQFPKLGIRVSLEGLPAVSDELRGMKDSFDHGLRTLLELTRIGKKDIGFSTTVCDRNARDMLHLFQLARGMGWEFATAAVHNSDYFHKTDNHIADPELVSTCLEELKLDLLRSWRIKNWFRAWFNDGIINYVRGGARRLPCPAASEVFFLDPAGEVLPCNGMERGIWYESLGNLHNQSFDEIWRSERAAAVRERVRTCPKNCWMIGTVSPLLRRNLLRPALWVAREKLRLLLGVRG